MNVTVMQAEFSCMRLENAIVRSTKEERQMRLQSTLSTVAKHVSEEKFVVLYICEISMNKGQDTEGMEVFVLLDSSLTCVVESTRLPCNVFLFVQTQTLMTCSLPLVAMSHTNQTVQSELSMTWHTEFPISVRHNSGIVSLPTVQIKI